MTDSSDTNPTPPPPPEEIPDPAPVAIPAAPPVQPVVPVDPIKKIPLDEKGNLIEIAPCRRCTYTLKGLPLSALCPECDLPIARSVLGDELRYCDSAWVRAVAQGIKLILVGIFSMIGIGVLLFAGMMIYIIIVAAKSGGGAAPNMSLIMAGSMVMCIPMLIAIFGTWRMTSPDPGQTECKWSEKSLLEFVQRSYQSQDPISSQ